MEYYDSRRVPLSRTLLSRIVLEEIGTIDGCAVYLVDGEIARDEVDVDFALGGHDARYRYIPHGTIWVEDTGSRRDVLHNLQHEAYERQLMLAGEPYSRAHARAARMELQQRKKH